MTVPQWPHANVKEPKPVSGPLPHPQVIKWLDGHGTVVDWGCGTAYSRHLFKKSRYVGVDGTYSPHADIIADLRAFKGESDCILLSAVLEHNWDWEVILGHAVNSFRKRMAIVFFIPPYRWPTTDVGDMNKGDWKSVDGQLVPNLKVPLSKVMEFIKPYLRHQEFLDVPGSDWKKDEIFLLEK